MAGRRTEQLAWRQSLVQPKAAIGLGEPGGLGGQENFKQQKAGLDRKQ